MPNLVEILITAKNESKAAFAEAEGSGNRLASTLTKVSAVGVVATAAIGVSAVKMATDYQSSTTRLVTSANEQTKNIDLVRQGMLKMAYDVGIGANDLSKGMYTVESAGYHGAAGLVVLKAAAQGAKDENADLATVANAVTDVLVDYHLKASDAAKVTSQMVEAVSFGKTNFQAFSSSMSNILPLAAAVHLKFADVSGVLAEMTSHGVTAQRASQNMANAIRSLEAPTTTMEKEFKALGISSDEVHHKLGTVGLAGTLEWLSKTAEHGAGKLGQTYPEAMKKLMGTAAGLNVALMTTGENAKGTQAAIAGISATSTEANGNVKGFAEVQKTVAFQFQQVKAAAETLMIELGDKLLPVVQNLLHFFTEHITTLKALAPYVLMFAGGIVALGVALKVANVVIGAYKLAVDAAKIAMIAFNAIMDANPISLIILAIAALAAGFIYLWTHSAAFRDFWITLWKDLSSAAISSWNWLNNNAVKPLWAGIMYLWNHMDDFLNFWKYLWDDVSHAAVSSWNWLNDNFIKPLLDGIKGMWDTLTGWWKSYGGEVEQVWKTEWDIISTVVKTFWEWIEPYVRTYLALITTLISVAITNITTVLKVAWDIISGVTKVAWTVISTYIKIAWDTISAVVKIAVAYIEMVLKVAWDVIVGALQVFLDLLTGHWSKALKDAQNVGIQVWNAIVGFLKTTWDALYSMGAAIFSNVSKMISGVWNAIWGTVKSVWGAIMGYFKGIWGDLSKGFSDVVSALGKTWNNLTGIFKTPVNFLINTVYDNGIARLWNDVMGAVGGPKLPTIKGLSTGGKLDGYGGGDKHLALLESGEAVVDKDRTAKFAPLLKAMGVPGFSTGGLIGDVLSGNVSGFIHDFTSMVGIGSGGAAGDLAKMITGLPVGMIKNLGSYIKNFATSVGGGPGLGGIFNVGNGPITGGAGAYSGIASMVLSALGQNPTYLPVVLRQIQTESGGNPTAVNRWDSNWIAGTPSVGLMQVIGPTFRSYAGPLRGVGPFEYGVSTNPMANIYAGLNYAIHRYGQGWTSVLGQGHGYASGGVGSGWATVGEHGRELVRLPTGSQVYPAANYHSMGQSNQSTIRLEVVGGGDSDFDRFMLKWVREKVRVVGGGNVQNTFGVH